MNTLHKLALSSFVFSLVFYFLFYGHTPGVSIFLGTLTLLLCIFLTRSRERKVSRFAYALAFFMLWTSGSTTFLAAEEIVVLNIFCLLILTILLAVEIGPNPWHSWRYKNYLLTTLKLPFTILGFIFPGLDQMSQTQKSQTPTPNKNKGILKGLLLALPLVIVFSALFRSANPYFDSFLSSIFRFQTDIDILGSILVILIAFLACFGLLRLASSKEQLFTPQPETEQTTASSEGTTFISTLAVLFLLFLMFQTGYIFGGEHNITAGSFTYAEYLHRGFAETIVSAILTTIVLLAVEKFYGKLKTGSWLYRASVWVVLVSTFAITLSTLYRMYLYQNAYGLSTPRLLVGIFSVWIALLLFLLGYKLFLAKKESFFISGGIVAGLVLWSIFLLSNPHALIAKTNLQRFIDGKKLDIYYLQGLSADAIPTIAEKLPKLQVEDQQAIKDYVFVEAKARLEVDSDWQSWNLAKTKSQKILSAMPLRSPEEVYEIHSVPEQGGIQVTPVENFIPQN